MDSGPDAAPLRRRRSSRNDGGAVRLVARMKRSAGQENASCPVELAQQLCGMLLHTGAAPCSRRKPKELDTDMDARSPMPRQISCAICDSSFACTLDRTCWCGEEPVRLPLPLAEVNLSDCICRSCLQGIAALAPEPWPKAAVLLDMDGTLIDSERVYATSLIRALNDFSFPDAEAMTRSMVGIPAVESQALLFKAYGADFPLAEVSAAYTRYRDELIHDGMPMKPGVIELLDAIAAANVPVAVVTASMRGNAENHLGHAGIRDRFDDVITRDDAARGKPFPDLYLLGAERLGVSPQDCIAVEDSKPGIASAHSAGTIPIMVPDVVTPDPDTRARAAVVLPDLHAVLQVLRFKQVL